MTAQISIEKRRTISPVFIGFLGMIVVPFCIVFATNSWSTPDAEAYVRMSFASVIANTISAGAAWWLAINRMRAGGRGRYWFSGVAAFFTITAVGGIGMGAERMLRVIETF